MGIEDSVRDVLDFVREREPDATDLEKGMVASALLKMFDQALEAIARDNTNLLYAIVATSIYSPVVDIVDTYLHTLVSSSEASSRIRDMRRQAKALLKQEGYDSDLLERKLHTSIQIKGSDLLAQSAYLGNIAEKGAIRPSK